MVAGREEAEGAEAVVDGDDDDAAPGGELLAGELVAGAVGELAVVDVEHDGEELGLTGLDLEEMDVTSRLRISI